MPFAVSLIILAAAIGRVFNKRLYETLPVSAFSAALAVYYFAMFMPLNIAVGIFTIMTVSIVIFAYMSFKKEQSVSKSSLIWVKSVAGNPLSITVSLVVCVLFCFLLANKKVFYYDDLSYWGLYTKNIFAIGKLPHLFENCSVDYKDYTPIIQILQYLAMFGRSTFSEPVMFQTNICFIYVLLLPMLVISDSKFANPLAKIASVIFYVIFPHILTAQFYYRLGVDIFLALTFGYVLYCIFGLKDIRSEETIMHDSKGGMNKDEIYRLVCIVSGLSFLALIKSSGIVLCLLALIFYVIREAVSGKHNHGRRTLKYIKTAIPVLCTLGTYFSWQLFLHYSWNNGYLSNRVKDGVKGDGFSLPSYTGEVIRNYVNHFFAYPLTRNRVGVTAFALVVFITAVYVIIAVAGKRSDKKTREYTALFAASMAGLAIFCIAHISMYLFVFDEWEAHGLLEYDRYITQYLGGVFYVFVCLLLGAGSFDLKTDSDSARKGGSKGVLWLIGLSLAVFIVLLPYADMKTYLVPANYKAMFENGYAQMSQAAADEWKSSGISELNLAHDGTERLTVIANAWDETTQFMEYEAVPQPIDRILNVPAVEEGDLVGFIYEYMESYMYVAKGAKAAYVGNWEETAEVTEDNTPLREGTLYRVNRLNDVKTLSPVY